MIGLSYVEDTFCLYVASFNPGFFTALPKIQTLIPLKSHLTEVNETLFAASVPMKQEADTGVLLAHFENGGDTSGTRWFPTGLSKLLA
jgi:hypothetical protein